MAEFLCFHGTSRENANKILSEQRFLHGSSDSLRLGEGAYFFCQMGNTSDYPIMCARELRRYKYYCDNSNSGYSILSCRIECFDEEVLDLCEPNMVETFHMMRYAIHERNLSYNPNFQYKNASVADTQVIEELKKQHRFAVVRAPQFFGMFEKERRMKFSDGKISQNPRTYVSNVVNLCANMNFAQVYDIRIVEEGDFDAECEGIIG